MIKRCDECGKLMHKNGAHLHRCAIVQREILALADKRYKKNVKASDYVKHTDWRNE